MQPRPRTTTAFLLMTAALLLSPVALADDPVVEIQGDEITGLLPVPDQMVAAPEIREREPDQDPRADRNERRDDESRYREPVYSGLFAAVDDADVLVEDVLNSNPLGLAVEDEDNSEPETPTTEDKTTTTGTDAHAIGSDADSDLLAAGAFTAATIGLAVAAAKKGLWVRIVSPLLAPLFSRFHDSTILDHPRRAELHQLVCRSPGITVPDMAETTGLSRNTILHHLRMMQQKDMLVSERMGRSVHWYENGGRYGRERKAAYAVLQDERSRDVARFIAANPGTPQGAVAQALGLAPSVITWHVKRLEDAALVQRRRTGRSMHCFPQDILPSLAL